MSSQWENNMVPLDTNTTPSIKKTNTHLQIPSCWIPPPPSQKNDIINTLVTRAIKIAYKDHLKQELDHLMKASIKNGYRDKKFKKTIKRANKKERNNNRKKEKQNNNNDTPLAILPYIHGTTNKIARILRKRDIKVTLSPPNSLRNMLDPAKDHIEKKLLQGVYIVPCSCNKVYIRETSLCHRTTVVRYQAPYMSWKRGSTCNPLTTSNV